MSKMQFVTIDSAKVREEVSKMEAESNYFHDLDYLSSNVLISDLKKLKEKLDSIDPNESNETLKKEFAAPLFNILKQWAYRSQKDDRYNIYQSYQSMLNNNKNEEQKLEFIRNCSKALNSNNEEKWDHNQPEFIVGKALMAIIEGKEPKAIRDIINDSIKKYTKESEDQTFKDMLRSRNFIFSDSDGQLFYINEKDTQQNKAYEYFLPENFPDLTGEQIGFIKSMWSQGKFESGWSTVIMASSIINGGTMISRASDINDMIPSTCFIKQDIIEGKKKTYVITSRKLGGVDKENNLVKIGNYTTIADISDLQNNDFVIGCASSNVPTKFIIEASAEVVQSLNIPNTISKSEISAEDQQILNKIGHDIPKALTQHSSSLLSEYFMSKLKSGTFVSSELKDKMKEDIITILSPFINNDEDKERKIKSTVGAMVRECASIASNNDSTIKLSLKQKIHHVIIDKLKSLFSSRENLKDIVGQDFIAQLKENFKPNKSLNNTIHRNIREHHNSMGRQ